MDLGYELTPLADRDTSFYDCIDIHISPEPTYDHYDPEIITMSVVDNLDHVSRLQINLTSPSRGATQLVAGSVCLRDRKGKCVDFFTFGGEVSVAHTVTGVSVHVCSEAPILFVLPFESAGSEIATFAQAQLARVRATWRLNVDGYFNRLKYINSTKLYQATLCDYLRQHKRISPALRSDVYWRSYRDVKEDIRWLQDNREWCPHNCTLMELLGCPD